jgi:hypothetical protein
MDKGYDRNELLNCSGRCVGMEAYRPHQPEPITRTALPAVVTADQPRPNRLLALFRQLTKQRDTLKDTAAWSNGNT